MADVIRVKHNVLGGSYRIDPGVTILERIRKLVSAFDASGVNASRTEALAREWKKNFLIVEHCAWERMRTPY
jgi:hypothetical protein